MQSSLNFLPQENKKQLLKVFLLRIGQRISALITIIAVIFGMAIVGMNYLLNSEIDRIKAQHENIRVYIGEESGETFEDAIQDLNQTTTRLYTIQEDYVYWSDVLVKVDSLIPNDIALESLALSTTSSSITIRGVAKTRDAYNEMRSNFTDSDFIDESLIPISLLKEDIPFNITATANKTLYAQE